MPFEAWRRRRGPGPADAGQDPTAGAGAAGGPAREPNRVDRLLASRVFDADFYSSRVGREFDDERAAARHCVRRGTRRGLSPQPLLLMEVLPPRVRRAWAEGRVEVLLDHLRAAADNDSALGPLFDAARAPGTPEQKRQHPGGALGLFLETSRDDAALPVRASGPAPGRTGPPTLGQARRALRAYAATLAAQESLLRPRTRTWTRAELDAWAAQVARSPHASPDPSGRPRVTVLLHAGDHTSASDLAAAVRSLREQTLPDWELLVTTDAEGDAPVLDPEVRTDPRVRVLPVAATSEGAGLDAGLRQGAGPVVALLDEATRWLPDFLRLGVAALDEASPVVHGAVLAPSDDADDDPDAGVETAVGVDGSLLLRDHVDPGGLLLSRSAALAVGGLAADLPRSAAVHDLLARLSREHTVSAVPVVAGSREPGSATDPDDGWSLSAVGRNLVDWDQVAAAPRVEGTVSVVMVTWQDWRMTRRAVAAVLEEADRTGSVDLDVVLVDNGSDAEVGHRLVGAFAGDDRVRYERLPRNLGFAIGNNVGVARSTGSVTVFLNNDTVVRPGWLAPLVAPLLDAEVRGVQPLLLYADDTVQSAGTVFTAPAAVPSHFLVGHPPEDATQLRERRFSAVTAAALAMRTDEVAALHGFDPLFVNGMEDVDLCLRATARYGGGFLLEPRSRVTHLEGKTPGRGARIDANRVHFMRRWRDALPAPQLDRYAELGLAVAHLSADASPVPAARPVVVRPPARLDEPAPRLRWGLKLPVTPGPHGDVWGDTYFADALAAALRRLGQQVVSYRRGTHTSRASHLDDVVLGLRGLEPVTPYPGKLNLLWVISHPDEVTPEEVRAFDAVFASSDPWSEEMSRRSGTSVTPLLQAVDLDHYDEAAPLGDGARPVFVGATNPDRERRAVLDAVQADIGLAVHGHGWSDTPAGPLVVTTSVTNADLPALYRAHGLVLADHWPDMAANGFVANRVFDAVAAGARVVSDDVTGIEDLFGGAVRVYRSVADLRELCGPAGRDRFPADEQLARISERVRAEHSFDRRAEELLDVALQGLRARAAGG